MSRTTARAAAMQMIFEKISGGQGGEDTLLMVYNELRDEGTKSVNADDPSLKDRAYIQAAFEGVMEHLDEIDQALAKHSKNWRLDRMGSVDLTILRLAAWEILFAEGWDVPGSVAISEAVHLAKQYADEDSGRFINGVLGSLLREKEAAE